MCVCTCACVHVWYMCGTCVCVHVWYMCVCTCVCVCVCVLGGGGKHDDLELYYTASHRLKYNHMGGDIRWLRRDRLIYREEGQTLH